MFNLIISNLRYYLTGILIIIIIYNLVIYLWNRRYLYFYFYTNKMEGPFTLPILGYAWHFRNAINEGIFKEVFNVFRNYKQPTVLWLGPELYFLITDPKHYQIILNSSKSLDKVSVYDFIKKEIGDGLLTATASTKWKRHRRLIQPTFNQRILNSFVDIFSEHSKIFVNDLNNFIGKGCIDIFPIFGKLSMTVVCNSILGYKILSEEQISTSFSWLTESEQLVYNRMFKPWFYPDIIWNLTSYSKKVKYYASNFRNIIKKIIVQKRNECNLKQKQNLTEKSFNEPDYRNLKGFLDHSIEILEETEQLTDDEMIEEASILLLAGSDTTAATSSFVLLMLALNTEIQDKVYDELNSIFGESDGQVEATHLNKMIYLERVIKETMRLCPTIPIIARKIDGDIHLESHILPKGSSCALGIFQTHHDPKIWQNPLEFNPDRFLPEEVAKRHPYAFIPFSGGPRNCIGIRYAMMAMKVFLSTVLRTYKVSTNYQKFSDIQFINEVVLHCVDGCNIAFEFRN